VNKTSFNVLKIKNVRKCVANNIDYDEYSCLKNINNISHSSVYRITIVSSLDNLIKNVFLTTLSGL
jgi:hypothetical protein